ncbi:GNAT family N-acetyltransferase [Pseudanabaena sp. PCC 6802]|uniref:GNAT family N-acetyltransferase n=1 Tax=Pseudanabaena sp. PCC 6802 TaxID=118173 RepID=UPI00034B335E|nr:GNAT family N-acetyltransferase [Pseudanabaena sp. PCC 6802]
MDTANSINFDCQIRSATPTDVETIFALIQALAAYEKLTDTCTGSIDALADHLFGDRPCAEAIVAECDDLSVGFALFVQNYSTFLTRPGMYLEDLFVLEAYRGRGIGKAMIRYLAGIAIERGYGRFEWSVLDWNEPAISFYQRMGADVLPDWRICRMTGNALLNLSCS